MTVPEPHRRLPIAVLISGGGTTLRNLIDKMREGTLNVDLRLVRVQQSGGRRARVRPASLQIPTVVVQRKDCGMGEAFSRAVFGPGLRSGRGTRRDGWVSQACPDSARLRAAGREHPSGPDSRFLRPGVLRVSRHVAVLEYGAKVSGCTVHLSPTTSTITALLWILQRTVEVRDDDTPETLADRIFEKECEAYPEAIRRFAKGRSRIVYLRVVGAYRCGGP